MSRLRTALPPQLVAVVCCVCDVWLCRLVAVCLFVGASHHTLTLHTHTPRSRTFSPTPVVAYGTSEPFDSVAIRLGVSGVVHGCVPSQPHTLREAPPSPVALEAATASTTALPLSACSGYEPSEHAVCAIHPLLVLCCFAHTLQPVQRHGRGWPSSLSRAPAVDTPRRLVGTSVTALLHATHHYGSTHPQHPALRPRRSPCLGLFVCGLCVCVPWAATLPVAARAQ